MPTSDSLRLAFAQVKRIRKANNLAKAVAHGGFGKEAQENYLDKFHDELQMRYPNILKKLKESEDADNEAKGKR